MREIKFKYYVEIEVFGKKEIVGFIFALDEIQNSDASIEYLIQERIEKYVSDKYCTCSLNESNPSCDCEVDFEWNCEIIARRQYTGLKDKNGLTEIYEGDIVNIKQRIKLNSKVYGDEKYNLIDKGNYLIKFGEHLGIGYVKQKLTDGILTGLDSNITYKKIYEVIGNIFENPELLEG